MLSRTKSGPEFYVESGDSVGRRRRAVLAQRFGGREVGQSGLSVFSYLNVAAAFEARRFQASGVSGTSVPEAAQLLGRHRAERIAAARRDEFHWRLVLRPDVLVDLDIVALMLLAPRGDRVEVTGWFGGRDEAIIRAPLEVAQLLAQD